MHFFSLSERFKGQGIIRQRILGKWLDADISEGVTIGELKKGIMMAQGPFKQALHL